ncbi:hypothetical protein M3650_08360 [Paenibacillus sp. MER TA 81-3]|nr:hypothetical protein [Paenibacillus sp. MER TA 81-3]
MMIEQVEVLSSIFMAAQQGREWLHLFLQHHFVSFKDDTFHVMLQQLFHAEKRLVFSPLDVYLNHVDMRQMRECIVQPYGLRLEFRYIVPVMLDILLAMLVQLGRTVPSNGRETVK